LIGNGRKAVRLVERTVELSGGRETIFLGTQAAACAEQRRFPEAIETTERPVAALVTQGKHRSFEEALNVRISLYEAEKPLCEGG
jgi:hypothetical protein